MTPIESLVKKLELPEIDWQDVERDISALEPDINWYDQDEHTHLTEVFMEVESGEILYHVTQLFLKHGYNVTANKGFNGYLPLHWLCWSCYDKYVLPIAELLLDAGADPHYPEDSTEEVPVPSEQEAFEYEEEPGVLGDVDWACGRWMTGDYESGNLYEAYYHMIKAVYEGQEYHGIRSVWDAVGKHITKITEFSRKEKNHARDIFVALWCEDIPLVVSPAISTVINPYEPLKALSTTDVTDEYRQLLGKIITEIRYDSMNSVRIIFKDGSYLFVFNDYMYGESQQHKVRLVYHDSLKETVLSAGMVFDSIRFPGRKVYSESTRDYGEGELILTTPETFYRIWQQGEEKKELYIDSIERPVIPDIEKSRTVLIGKLIFETAYFTDNRLIGLRFKSDEGYFYIRVGGFREMELLLTDEDNSIHDSVYANSTLKQLPWKQFFTPQDK